MNARDPGWKPALKNAWRGILLDPILRAAKKDRPGLEALRLIWLSLPISWALFGIVMIFLEGELLPERRWTLAMVAGVGAAGLIFLRWLRSSPVKLKGRSDSDVIAATYAKRSFTGFSATNTIVLVGFVAFFVGGGMPAYLLGIPFGLTGFAAMAPTRSNLERFQRRLREAGVSISLLQSLSGPLPQPKKDPGSSGPDEKWDGDPPSDSPP